MRRPLPHAALWMEGEACLAPTKRVIGAPAMGVLTADKDVDARDNGGRPDFVGGSPRPARARVEGPHPGGGADQGGPPIRASCKKNRSFVMAITDRGAPPA